MLETKKVSLFLKKNVSNFISSSSENVGNLEGNIRNRAIVVRNGCLEQSFFNFTKSWKFLKLFSTAIGENL